MALYLVSFLLLGAAHAASVPAVSANDESLPAAIDRRAALFCSVPIPNCNRCDATNTARCRQCASGYTPTNSGSQCVMIRCGILDCLECVADPPMCTKCADGLEFVDGVCQKPAVAPPGGDTNSPPMPPEQPPCNVAGCDTCSWSNPNVCLTCQPGTTIMNNGAQCLASQATCSDSNCVSCSAGSPDTCLACNAAEYTLVDGKCLSNACVVPGCTKCAAGQPSYCSRCQSGMTPSGGKCYYISCGIRNCRTCIAGPNTCTQCVPGFTQNADATDCVPIV